MSLHQEGLRQRNTNKGSKALESSPPASSASSLTEEEESKEELHDQEEFAKPTFSTKVVFYPPSNKYWRIGSQWYDFSSFNHPGGKQVLEMARDRFDDATFAFEAHHHNFQKARKIIRKYLVEDQDQAQRMALKRPGRADKGFPDVTHHDKHLDANQHPKLTTDESFYSVLRERVAKYLNEVGCPKGEPTWACIAFFWAIFAGWFAGITTTYYTGSFLAAVYTGIVGTWLASFGHNWVHQPRYKHWGWGILSLDMVGLDSEVWFRDHVMHHHMFTNTPWDHHITALDPFITQDQTIPRNWFQIHIGPYLLHVLFSIGTYSAYILNWVKMFQGQENFCFGKLIFPIEHYLFYQAWGLKGLALMLVMTATTGNFFYTIAFMNHNAEHCTDIKARNKSKDWGEAQLRSCADFAIHLNFYQSMMAYVMLNFHTVHHLFPKVDFCHHPAISDIMIETAKEFNIPYRCGNPWDIYWEMYDCYASPTALYEEWLVYAGSI